MMEDTAHLSLMEQSETVPDVVKFAYKEKKISQVMNVFFLDILLYIMFFMHYESLQKPYNNLTL